MLESLKSIFWSNILESNVLVFMSREVRGP